MTTVKQTNMARAKRHCKHGHKTFRYRKSGSCVTCSKLRGRRKCGDPAEQAKRRARMKRYAEANQWHYLLIGAHGRAKDRSVPFSLNVKWARNHWSAYCELSGLPFDLSVKKRANLFSPSIDRIDASKGYSPDNCRFILHGINMFKGAATDEDIYVIAEALLRHRDRGVA